MYNHFLPLCIVLVLVIHSAFAFTGIRTFDFPLCTLAFDVCFWMFAATLVFHPFAVLLEPFRNCSQFCSLSTFLLLRLSLADFEFTFEFVNSWSNLF